MIGVARKGVLIVLALVAVTPVQGRAVDLPFESITWLTESAFDRGWGEEFAFGRGRFCSARFYSDFELRGEFRGRSADAAATLVLRAHDSRRDGGYAVALTADSRQGEWQAFTIRARAATVTATIGGAAVEAPGPPDRFAGTICLEARAGTVEYRGLRVRRLRPPEAAFTQDVFRPGDAGIQAPQPTHVERPYYPRIPFDARTAGTVLLECVIDPIGAVGDVRVIKSVHPDLDEAAIGAARAWRFKPATRDGQPVWFVAPMEITFQIKR